MNRRKFIRQGTLSIAAAAAGLAELTAKPRDRRLIILHTNDVHSRIEPFPMDGGRFQGLGGASRRAALIREIRREQGEVLLLDSGDFFQGSPYFNLYRGEVEIRLMNEMGYDAATLGNHEFDLGLENLALQVRKAEFPIISSNYDFTGTPMEGLTRPYLVIERAGMRIGILALGIDLEGLVPSGTFKAFRYLDPLERAGHYAAALHGTEQCDLIICLSHLGLRYRNDKVSDLVLAANSRHIDIILGGHTHSFLDEPLIERNPYGRQVLINQAGWGGIVLGRIDVSPGQRGPAGRNLKVAEYQ
jgi:5'-nucleotidase